MGWGGGGNGWEGLIATVSKFISKLAKEKVKAICYSTKTYVN